MIRLFSIKPLSVDFGLFLLRVGLGGLIFLQHGLGKLTGFADRADNFYNFMGLGSQVTLGLAVFAEFLCAIFLILGLMTRWALIPLICTMTVVVLMVYGGEPLAKKELPLLFLSGFITLFFTGPGKMSVDNVVR
ncbi:MAG: DoxX family protein [Cyclobacteriaceae bacterium]|nr:DoxX family protein [Cyclobacteriaceae bacterium]